MKKTIVQIVSILLLSGISLSFNNENSASTRNHLFKIERSKDANEIFYDINSTLSGKLNTENPIQVYWIKHAEKAQAEPLTWIQEKYSYGLKFLKVSENEAEFQFVSYNKRNFFIKKLERNVFKVFTISEKKLVEVNRIFIQIDGGTFWLPKISRVELHATNVKSGAKTIEIINP